MSGIVGLLHPDGSPIDRQLLDRMTSFLAFRGPDAVHTWVGGNVGLGHTLLRTTEESASERQPLTLDQQAWIVADARIDAREELIIKLAAKGRTVSPSVPDVELILHAYHEWGEECVDHLLGDFSFAIWDGPRRGLFCARDHFGVNQFYYASVGNRFVFSNSLNCIRLDPSISAHLDDSTIGDFLLLGLNSDPSATAFAEIRRLAPAHLLSVSDAGVSLRRYWTLPVEDEIRYRHERDYAGQFRELLGRAVRDRFRAPRASLLMSGGLDSSSVAATAGLAATSSQGRLKAFTIVHEHLIPDEERRYSGLVARALNLPIQYLPVDDYNLFDGWEDVTTRPSEAFCESLLAIQDDALRQASAFSRVVLTGQGGDPALSTSVSHHARFLLKRFRLVRLLRDFGRFALAEGRFSRLYLGTRWRVFRSRLARPAGRPAWLAPQFSARFPYEERASQIFAVASFRHPLHPHAYQVLTSPVWPYYFALYDAGTTRVPVECRHPYFDLRVIRFLLRVPPVPWCTDKEIVRLALRGMLPDSIRLRRKSPLTRDVVPLLLRRPGHWWRDVPPAPGIEDYVQWQRLPHQTAAESSDAAWSYLSAVGLNLWLAALSAKSGLSSAGEPSTSVRPILLETSR